MRIAVPLIQLKKYHSSFGGYGQVHHFERNARKRRSLSMIVLLLVHQLKNIFSKFKNVHDIIGKQFYFFHSFGGFLSFFVFLFFLSVFFSYIFTYVCFILLHPNTICNRTKSFTLITPLPKILRSTISCVCFALYCLNIQLVDTGNIRM